MSEPADKPDGTQRLSHDAIENALYDLILTRMLGPAALPFIIARRIKQALSHADN